MRYIDKSIPDWSRPELPTTASNVARQGICENYATAWLSENNKRKRGERRVKRQRQMWKGRHTLIRVCIFKYRNNDWKGERAGRLDGAKECRYTVPTGNKVEKE